MKIVYYGNEACRRSNICVAIVMAHYIYTDRIVFYLSPTSEFTTYIAEDSTSTIAIFHVKLKQPHDLL